MDRTTFELEARKAIRGLRVIVVALVFAALGATSSAAQQTGTVTGVIRDAVSQEPIANVQVSVEGTGLGVLSQNTGRYLLLNVPAGQQTIRATIIGYGEATQTVNVPAGESVSADFQLRTEAISLEGVVVTGTAGQARRREVGNAISQVSSRDIEVSAVTDIGDILQGRTTGIQVNDYSGQVGTASQIRLRGNNSLTQGNDPLIYLDGVRIEVNELSPDDEQGAEAGLFDMINPNDIERVEVVKGPAATTLYGTEAAGGVIQIFTKRGSAGAPVWTLSVDQGFSNMGHIGGSLNPESINPTGLNLNDCSHEPGCPEGGSWFRNGYLQRYDLSVRGGNEDATYFVSGRWGEQQGVIDPQGAEDYSIRANVSFQPFDGLDIRLNNAYSNRGITWIPDGNNAGGLLLNILRGDAGYTPGNDDSVILKNELLQDIQNVQVGASVTWAPNANFSHRLNAGMDYTASDYTDFKPWGEAFDAPEGDREVDENFDRNLTLDYAGSYEFDPSSSVTSRTSFGGQLYEEYSWGVNGFDNTFAGPGDALVGDGTIQSVGEGRQTVRSGGFFFEEMIGFQDKLFLTGGVRWDGFSTFGEGFGLAAYPKLAASYTISDESFWPSDVVETMKLRAAWGESGKAPGAFDAELVYEAGVADEQEPAVYLDNLGNPDLGPERSSEIEWGFDASAFGGRIFLEFTSYDQTTTDALIGVEAAPSLGTNINVLRNLGEVKNWGTETTLNVIPVRGDDIEWSVGVGYSTNDSEITDLGPLEDLGSTRQLGEPLWIEYNDWVQNPDAVGELPVLEDEVIGPLFPTSTVNLSTRLTLWRSLTLDVLGEGQYGHVRESGPAYQNMRRTPRSNPSSNPAWPYCVPIIEEWNANGQQPGNLTALEIAQCIQEYSDSGVWTDRADFFKLRSASLSYRLPEGTIPGTQSATLSLRGKNLFTLTDYVGLDPEANDNGFGDQTPREYYTLPPPRTFIFNVRVTF